jgi:hypothetical protein
MSSHLAMNEIGVGVTEPACGSNSDALVSSPDGSLGGEREDMSPSLVRSMESQSMSNRSQYMLGIGAVDGPSGDARRFGLTEGPASLWMCDAAAVAAAVAATVGPKSRRGRPRFVYAGSKAKDSEA